MGKWKIDQSTSQVCASQPSGISEQHELWWSGCDGSVHFEIWRARRTFDKYRLGCWALRYSLSCMLVRHIKWASITWCYTLFCLALFLLKSFFLLSSSTLDSVAGTMGFYDSFGTFGDAFDPISLWSHHLSSVPLSLRICALRLSFIQR